jgi:hypothetical protein
MSWKQSQNMRKPGNGWREKYGTMPENYARPAWKTGPDWL